MPPSTPTVIFLSLNHFSLSHPLLSQNTIAIPLYGEARNQETLHAIVQHYVDEGSTVVTDEWRGHIGHDDNGFIHWTVNHSENFVDPDNALAHTNTVEGSNKWLREALPDLGLTGDLDNYGRWIAGRYLYPRLLKYHPALCNEDPARCLLRHLEAWRKAGKPAVRLGMDLVNPQ